MKHDDYIEIQTGDNYRRVTYIAGVRTTICENRFEILTDPNNEINEQFAVQELRKWIHGRKKEDV